MISFLNAFQVQNSLNKLCVRMHLLSFKGPIHSLDIRQNSTTGRSRNKYFDQVYLIIRAKYNARINQMKMNPPLPTASLETAGVVPGGGGVMLLPFG